MPETLEGNFLKRLVEFSQLKIENNANKKMASKVTLIYFFDGFIYLYNIKVGIDNQPLLNL
jgi:hypothetical protein